MPISSLSAPILRSMSRTSVKSGTLFALESCGTWPISTRWHNRNDDLRFSVYADPERSEGEASPVAQQASCYAHLRSLTADPSPSSRLGINSENDRIRRTLRRSAPDFRVLEQRVRSGSSRIQSHRG